MKVDNWIFYSERIIPDESLGEWSRLLSEQWKTHGEAVNFLLTVLEDHFLVIQLEVPTADVSGCSKDQLRSLVGKFLGDQALDGGTIYIKYESDLLAFRSMPDFIEWLKSATHHLVYVLSAHISNKDEMENSWEVSLRKSYLNRYFVG